MKKQLFDELVGSIRQTGKMHRGEAAASRRFVFEPEAVRAIREKLKKSQSEFAQMIGVSRRRMSWRRRLLLLGAVALRVAEPAILYGDAT